jgi:hypothetical protein
VKDNIHIGQLITLPTEQQVELLRQIEQKQHLGQLLILHSIISAKIFTLEQRPMLLIMLLCGLQASVLQQHLIQP